ncbi:MAG: APC family permease [Actinobacteria bacterium]|nr:APC family permease [Actinomycetota bacterium]
MSQLERNAVGLREVVFQSICCMAPAAAIAASIPFGSPLAGGALPLAVILAFVGIAFTASSVGQLAAHIPSAGSVATYSAVGLRPWIGFLVGWAYFAVEILIVPLVMLQLGYTVAGEWNSENASFSVDNWWIFTTLGSLLVAWLVYRGIRTSAKTGVILGAIEIVVFVVLGLILIVKAGGNNDLAVFSPKYANAEGFNGWSGVIAGSVFCLLAFAGFEASAPLAEETENPKKNIPKAVMIATLSIGALYALTTYAAAVTFGPEKFKEFAGYNNGVPWDGLAKSLGTIFWLLALFAIINSTIANANGGANVFTRTAFAFGRAGALPRSLAKLHPTYKSPQNAVALQLVLGLVISLGLGLKYKPQMAFGIVATALVVAIVPVYMLTNLACIGYFTKHRREDRHPVIHILVPVVGFIFLIPGFFNAAGITGVPGLKFIVSLASPLTYGAYAMGIWMIAGLIALLYLKNKNPKAIDEVATIHI